MSHKLAEAEEKKYRKTLSTHPKAGEEIGNKDKAET